MGIDPQRLYLWSSICNFQIIWILNSLFGPAIVTVSITLGGFLWILLVSGVSWVFWGLLLPKFYEAPPFLLQEILNSKGIAMQELSFICILESDCTATSVHIYIGLVWYIEPLVHQLNFTSSPVSTLRSRWYMFRQRKQCTCWEHFLVYSGLSEAHSYIYYFHLMMEWSTFFILQIG